MTDSLGPVCRSRTARVLEPLRFSDVLPTLAPILVGAGIYLLWRSPALWVFGWAESIGALPLVVNARNLTSGVGDDLPAVVLFSLPDGLWVYAVTVFMIRLWRDEGLSLSKLFWVSSGLGCGILGEVGQGFGWVPGTFDVADLAVCFFAGLYPVALHARSASYDK